MKGRIEERRRQDLTSLLIFLHTSKIPQSNQYLTYDGKKTIKQNAFKIHRRLFPREEDNPELEETPEIPAQAEDLEENEDEMEKSIKSVMEVGPTESSFEKDFKMFEATKQRTESLNQLMQALKTVQATSTIVERVFSVAGSFVTKVRNRLAPKKTNMLVFLKYYFLREY